MLEPLQQTTKALCGTTFWSTHHIRVVLHVVVRVNEKNVLRLQIGVRQLVSMQNWKKIKKAHIPLKQSINTLTMCIVLIK